MKLWIVNVLEGVIFISTTTTTFNKVEIKEVCQCPERGDLHFYLPSPLGTRINKGFASPFLQKFFRIF